MAEHCKIMTPSGPINGRAFVGAYRKGQQAARDGMSEADCPYEDLRDSYRNSVTFSRAFRRAWLEGFRVREDDA
jgi:ribosome modulation factor